MLKPPARQRGAATLEFHIVALFAMLPLCLGTLQIALLLAENPHIDHATFQAARSAAMAQGDLQVARRAFAQTAVVLFADASSEVEAGNVAARVTSAYALALADQLRFSRFRIISPSPEAQLDFATQRGGVRVIPNDSLEYRSAAPGARSGQSIQQANMLHLEVSWCRPLIVPFARQMLLGALRVLDRDAWNQYCYSQQRVPIRSLGVTPMQSDFRVTS